MMELYRKSMKRMEEEGVIKMIEILVRSEGMDTFNVDVKEVETIHNIKVKIQEIKGIPWDKQVLSYKGKKLEDDCNVADYNIENKSTLDLIVPPPGIQLFIKSDGIDTFTIDVKEKETIHNVKMKIQEIKGIPCDVQILFYQGQKQRYKLKDDCSLADYNIENKSILDLIDEKKMKEEALKKGEELLRAQPDLRNKTEIRWSEKGTGSNFVMLCELLKGNAIPTKKLDLDGNNIGDSGARMISEALKTNNTLTALSLGSDNNSMNE